jgi:hypothetical protein
VDVPGLVFYLLEAMIKMEDMVVDEVAEKEWDEYWDRFFNEVREDGNV